MGCESKRRKAARAQASARYDNFVATLGWRLNDGPKLRQEIPEDIPEIPFRDRVDP